MPVDTSIFSGLLRPPKSVADYDLDAANLKRAQLQNQTLDANNQAAGMQRDRANQLLQLSRSMPQGATDLDRLASLRNAGFYDEADKLSTSLDNRTKTKAIAAKDTADAADMSFKTTQARKQARVAAISQFTNPQDAIAHIADGVAKGDITQEDADRMARNVPNDPSQFGQWQLRTIQALMKPDDQVKQISPDANARLQATTSTANNEANNARMAAEGSANRSVAMRGQDLTNARVGAGGKAPAGYAWGPADEDGQPSLVPIPGGPADKSGKQKDIPATVNAKIIQGKQGISNIDSAIKAIEDYPDALGFTNALTGMQSIRQVTDPKGVAARAQVANIGSLTLHDRSGAAVSASEFPRLAPFIPSASDSPQGAVKKLKEMRRIASEELGLYAGTYGPDNGYKAHPLLSGGAAPSGGGAPAGDDPLGLRK